MRDYGGLGAVCRQCSAFGFCTKNRYRGRELLIGPYDTVLRIHREWMATDKAKALYKRRKELSEPSFGIIKDQMGMRRFLLRGWDHVKTEAIVLATAFNLRTLCHLWRTWTSEKRGQIAARLLEGKVIDSILGKLTIPGLATSKISIPLWFKPSLLVCEWSF